MRYTYYDINKGAKRLKSKIDFGKSLMGLVALALPVVLFLSNGGASAATTVVTNENMQGWAFVQETPVGSGQMENGPESPPLGSGSANLNVSNVTGGEALIKAAYQGTQLSDITNLEYSTYRTSGGDALAIALQFNIDYDTTDTNTGFQGRLVYEPYHTQTVLTGEWQTWDPLNDAAGTGTGNWWFTPGTGFRPGALTCPQSNPCTWAEVNALYPNAAVHSTLGAVVLKAGSGWATGFDGNVDALTVNNDTYNFEFANVPANKDACKKDGYMTLTDQNGQAFKNQGQCVSWTNGRGQ